MEGNNTTQPNQTYQNRDYRPKQYRGRGGYNKNVFICLIKNQIGNKYYGNNNNYNNRGQNQ